jgi:hypothetical protein
LKNETKEASKCEEKCESSICNDTSKTPCIIRAQEGNSSQNSTKLVVEGPEKMNEPMEKMPDLKPLEEVREDSPKSSQSDMPTYKPGIATLNLKQNTTNHSSDA